MMESAGSKFKIGDAVIVAVENPTGNPRTPKYIRGKRGVVGSSMVFWKTSETTRHP